MSAETCINKLHVNGFKSFQTQTAIPFYKGMTAIVGSNGSGKSNIIDAMSFVLGKRSSKLRAEKMEQLIFNGGENRKAAEKAEVYLHLDNSDGTFDKFLEDDEDADEVKIGRKVTKKGYSTYRFQDNNCKRSKIDRILEEAGIDPDSHHFVRQGKITSIVKQTATERRKLIDRISGIESFDKKKDKALEELEEVQDRLNEFQIKKDMKKERLERLKEQKESAEKYKELEEKKRKLKYSILKMRKKSLKKEMENLGEEEKEEEIEELEEEVEDLDEELEELQEEKDRIQEDIDDSRDSNILQEIERLRGKIERKKGKIENKREKIDDIEELVQEYEKLSGYKGRNRAVKKVLDMDKDGVYGTVGQLIHYDDRYGAAIETALGAKIDNIVVRNYQIANECVNFLKSNNIGRATFLPLDKVKPHNKTLSSKNAVKKPGVIDFATNLIDYDEDYNKAIKHVLGDTLVSEDLESLKDSGRVRAVTLDGDIMRKGGSVTGGKKKKRRKNKSKGGSSKKGINPEKKKQKKKKLQKDIDDLKGEIGDLSELLEEKKKEEKNQSQVSEELAEEKEEIQEEIEEKREERKEKAERLEKLKGSIGKVRKKRAKFEAELDNVSEDLKEFEDMDEEEAIEDDVSNLRRKKTRTLNKMNDLGNVNMAAIEEYEEFQEEYDDFLEKVEKAREEKQEVEEMIKEIEEKKENKFMNTLDKVSSEFKRIFQKLFDGGEAALELEEEGNIDSGLVIRAQPPEKDPEVIDSLSGGEKTLTAIAFVFAIQEYNPSPFYVMDEIDAALDASNSRRLSELLKGYSEDSQLIFISHNEETVRHADRAYGISMQEGVSKVRSIEI